MSKSKKLAFAFAVFTLLLTACEPSGQVPDFTTLSGVVWLDKNGNGLQDTGEEGVDKVTVNLLSLTGSLLEEQFTGGAGYYIFKELNQDSAYSIQVVLPSGYAFTTKDVGGDDEKDSDVFESGASIGRSDEIPNLIPPNGDVDAGLTGGPDAAGVEDEAEVVITGFVWLDANGNGLFETGEEPLADVEVSLLSTEALLTVLEAVKTDSEGNVSFSPRAASGTYRLFYFNPTEYDFTLKDQGADDDFDSDVWEAGGYLGHTDVFDLAQGAPPDLAAGLVNAVFRPKLSGHDLIVGFEATSLPCGGDMVASFSLPFHVELMADGILELSSSADGSTARGTIEHDGHFHLEDVDGYGSWDGWLNRFWEGTGVNLYKDTSGCITSYDVGFHWDVSD